MSSQERLLTVVLRPVISEKATMVADKQKQVVFEVLRDATKTEVKAAVEHNVTEKTSIELAVKNSHKSGSVAPIVERGSRTDLGVKLTHDIDDNSSAYVFGQEIGRAHV